MKNEINKKLEKFFKPDDINIKFFDFVDNDDSGVGMPYFSVTKGSNTSEVREEFELTIRLDVTERFWVANLCGVREFTIYNKEEIEVILRDYQKFTYLKSPEEFILQDYLSKSDDYYY